MPGCRASSLPARKSKMKRNATMAVLVLLMLTWGIPVHGANKEDDSVARASKAAGKSDDKYAAEL